MFNHGLFLALASNQAQCRAKSTEKHILSKTASVVTTKISFMTYQ
jgi:hypothetical protein